jgi:glucosamine--fructose-6-phosphate aminotransferase (isomerizing)
MRERPSQNSNSGAYSLAEILSQPQTWASCIQGLSSAPAVSQIRNRFAKASEWLFIGCGSSYYIALTAAASWTAITGTRARAIPASELILFPELTLAGSANFAPVLISRSGRTSEVLQAAELLNRKNIPSIAMSCAAGQKLEQLASITILLTPADEQSTVMTRAFTSMLLALQYLAAVMANKSEIMRALEALSGPAEPILRKLPQQVRDFVAQQRFADYVCLGQGPYYGLACESALKLTEMSGSYAQVFHTLEFRHGPKSIVRPETLIIFLLSEHNYATECDVLEEIKSLGATTLVLTNKADRRAHAAADFLLEFAFDLPEFARLAPFVFAGQLMGLYTGLHKGLDPDHPRNLTRAVILEGNKDKIHHAGI